jgi:hypothetical protein
MSASTSKMDSEIERIEKLAKKLVHELSDCRLRAANNLLTKFQRNLVDVSLFSSNLSFGRNLLQRINDALCLIINDSVSAIDELPHDDIFCMNALLQLIVLIMNSSKAVFIDDLANKDSSSSPSKRDPLPILLDNLYKINSMKAVPSTTKDYLKEVSHAH